MMRRLIRKVFGLGRSGHKIYTSKQLGFKAQFVSKAALKTVQTLQHHGFEAYIVGGAVRDLLIGRAPKDFDVATNASPEQVLRIFRRAWLIGRRFQIVHVRYGAETIEVTTFRGEGSIETGEHGQLLQDNVFGNQSDDASRRDFSVNALYYDPVSERIYDFHHGVEDIQSNVLRVIGQAEQRYREDPVRMLRAVRFAAKLGLDIETKTRKPFARLADLLEHTSDARRFDEAIKFLTCGASHASIHKLYHEKLYRSLFPLLDEAMTDGESLNFIQAVLTNTDLRISQSKPINPAFAFAALLWGPLETRRKKWQHKGMPFYPALAEAIDELIDVQYKATAIPRRIFSDIREIWQLQSQFENPRGKRPYRLISHPRFRAALDFMLLRAETGLFPKEMADWWQLFLENPQEAEKQLLTMPADHLAPARRRKKRVRRKTKGKAGETTESTTMV